MREKFGITADTESIGANGAPVFSSCTRLCLPLLAGPVKIAYPGLMHEAEIQVQQVRSFDDATDLTSDRKRS